MFRRVFVPVVILVSFSLFSHSVGAAIKVVDDLGNTVELKQPAKRIVTLAPFLTELVFAIQAQDTLLATVEFSNYPDEARQVPRIGNFENVNVEKLVALQPDLVLGWESANNLSQLKRLEKLGLPLYRSEPRELTDIPSTITRLGILLGRQQQANQVAESFNQRLGTLVSQYRDRAELKAFYQVWHKPVYTINGQHIISKVMAICGLQNVFAELPVLGPKITVESVISKNPQMIIASGMATAEPEWLEMWRAWPDMRAVKYNNLYFIHPDLIQRHSLRILDATQILCEQADQARENLGVKK